MAQSIPSFNTFILFTFIVVFQSAYFCFADTSSTAVQFALAQQSVSRANSLEYGDDCDPTEVEFKEVISKSLESLLQIGTSSVPLQEAEFKKFIETADRYKSIGKLCDSNKLLSCDKSNNLCNCGPHRLVNREFSYSEDSGKCRFKKDSACFSTDYMAENEDICTDDTSCVLNDGNGKYVRCNILNLQKSIAQSGKFHCYCKNEFETPKSYSEMNILNTCLFVFSLILSCFSFALKF